MQQQPARRLYARRIRPLALFVLVLAMLALPLQASGAVGQPHVLATPLPGGFVHGVTGTPDPAALAARQPFEVESIWLWDVPNQRWLAY